MMQWLCSIFFLCLHQLTFPNHLLTRSPPTQIQPSPIPSCETQLETLAHHHHASSPRITQTKTIRSQKNGSYVLLQMCLHLFPSLSFPTPLFDPIPSPYVCRDHNLLTMPQACHIYPFAHAHSPRQKDTANNCRHNQDISSEHFVHAFSGCISIFWYPLMQPSLQPLSTAAPTQCQSGMQAIHQFKIKPRHIIISQFPWQNKAPFPPLSIIESIPIPVSRNVKSRIVKTQTEDFCERNPISIVWLEQMTRTHFEYNPKWLCGSPIPRVTKIEKSSATELKEKNCYIKWRGSTSKPSLINRSYRSGLCCYL